MPDRIYGPGQHIHAYKTRQEQLRRTMQELSGEGLNERSISEPISQGQVGPRQQKRLETHQKFVTEQNNLASLLIAAEVEGKSSPEIEQATESINNLLQESIEESDLLTELPFKGPLLTQKNLATVHKKTPRLLALAEKLHTPTKEMR